jgi:long-chain acyl-CoA synthetase
MAEKINYADKPWLNMYERFRLPTTAEPYPKVPLFEYLDKAARDRPDATSCIYLGKEMTYKELGEQADRLATALFAMGVKKGERVATILPTSPQFIISDHSVLKTGGVIVPCSTLHKAPDLEYELGEAGVKTMICIDSSLGIVNSIKDSVGLENIIITSLKDYSSEETAPEEIAGAYQLRNLIAEHEPNPPKIEIDPVEDLALLPFTGGATGVPKGVMLTHYNMTSNVHQLFGSVFGILTGSKAKVTLLMSLPFFHQYGHWAMFLGISMGATMLLVPDARDYDMIIELMRKYRPIMSIGVPTQYMKLAAKELKGIRTIGISGSAALPPEVAKTYEKKTKSPLGEGYGLTETSPVTHMNITSFMRMFGGKGVKEASIGTPILDTEVKVVDENGEDVPIGEIGEMVIRGPQVMKGYWPTPGKGLEDGWLRTGDLVKMDEDGYFYVVDRTKDMINVSGNKVYSRVVDDVLFEHPGVEVGGVIGIPDPERSGSERIKAFIKLKPGYEGKISADDIIKHCREKLPPYAAPKFVEFRDDLPLTVTEKVFKRKLREEEIEKMREAGLLK